MLLQRLLGPSPAANNPFDERYWPTEGQGWSMAGVQVNDSTALQISAFFACVAILGETMGMLPFPLLRQAGRDRMPVTAHPLYGVLHDQANDEQTSMEWREWMTAVAVMRGRAVSEIIDGPRGEVQQLRPLHPDWLTSDRLPDGTERFTVRQPGKPQRTLLRSEVFIVRGRLGLSIVAQARETVGMARAIQTHQARTFKRGVKPSGVVKGEGELSEPAFQRFKAQFNDEYAGAENSGKPIFLEGGYSWQQISLSSVDAQGVEWEKLTIADIARWFRMQAHKIGDLEHATFSNIEHMGIEFVTDTVMPWCTRWEQAVTRDLLLPAERAAGLYPKFTLQGLLRGDSMSRSKFYETGIRMGYFTRNEVREWEDLNPIDGLDDPLDPQKMPGGSGGQGDQSTIQQAGGN